MSPAASRVLQWTLFLVAGMGVPWLLGVLPLATGELERAEALGLISATTRAGYPKAQELPVYLWVTLLVPIGAAWLARRQGASWSAAEPSKQPRWVVPLTLLVLGLLAYDLGYIFEAAPWGRFGFLGEEGVYLGTAQALGLGGRLYEDVFFPYGPLMGWPLPLAVSAAGDEMLGYRLLVWGANQLGMLLICLGLWKLLQRRALLPGWLLICGALCIPVLPNWNATTLRLALPVAASILVGWGALGDRRSRSWCLGGGLLAAIGAGFSFDGGAAGVVAVAGCCLLPLWVDRSWGRTRSVVAWTGAGAAVAALPLGVALLVRGELGPALQTVRLMLDLPAAGYQALPWPDVFGLFRDITGQRQPFPPSELAYSASGAAGHAGEVRALALWATWPWLLVGVCTARTSLGLLRGRSGLMGQARQRLGALAGLAMVSVLLGRGALGRSDLYHLQFYGALPALLCTAVLVEDLLARFDGLGRASAAFLSSLVLLALLSWPPRYYAPGYARDAGSRFGWLDTEQKRIDRPRVDQISLPPELAEEVLAVRDWAMALPSDTGLWFYPSEASYYWITDRPLPHPYLWAYDAATQAQRQALIISLTAAPPDCVVETEGTFQIDHIPAGELLPEVEAWLRSRYVESPASGFLPGVRIGRFEELPEGACMAPSFGR